MSDATFDGSAEVDEDTSLQVLPLPAEPALVSRMEIRGLFGRYDYTIRIPPSALSDRLLLFYSDNGKGKTTVLRLLWHLLSPANNRNHRTCISKIVFQRVTIELSDGAEITVSRPRAEAGTFSIRLMRNREVVSDEEWPGGEPSTQFDAIDPDELQSLMVGYPEHFRDQALKSLRRRAYLSYLGHIQARPFFLADDRNIYSDDLDNAPRSRRERELRAIRNMGPDGESFISPENLQGFVALELETSMRRTNELLRQMTLGGTASGSANANSVYLDVVRRLRGGNRDKEQVPETIRAQLVERLETLGNRSRGFERLGLVPKFDSVDFTKALEVLTLDRVEVAEEVLGPFLASFAARLDALQDAQTLIQTFLDETNGFLIDKHLTFNPNRGLRISLDEGQALSPPQLSSGERQLVLLLCNALLAREGTRLFLVDEPELSLNAKWQRKIVPALLACTAGTSVQFIIATHSLELLSAFRSNVVTLQEDPA